MQKVDGQNYAPTASGKKVRVVNDGEFVFSVIGLDHGHIYAMTNGLLEAGASIRYVYDDDPLKVKKFVETYPEAVPAQSVQQILDSSCDLVAGAARPDRRFEIGMKVLESGKHYFSDKPGFLKPENVREVRTACRKYNKKYYVYFGERVHVEGAVMAQQMIDDGLLGEIVSINILAPHRLNPTSRPDWFWKPELNGGIISDIGCHQLEQFLSYAHAQKAELISSTVGNFANPEHPDFQDFGELSLVTDNKVMGFCHLDWFTPKGMSAWGDGRVFIVGTKATLEVRKYLDIAGSKEGDQLYFADEQGEHHISAYGKTGFPFFGQFILDCMNGTEISMTQEHVLESMRLAIEAQQNARFIRK